MDYKNITEYEFPDLNDPKIQKEILKSKMRNYERIKPFLMEQWPAELWQLTKGLKLLIPFPAREFLDCYDGKENPVVRQYFDMLDSFINGKQWFIKLHSRSPKDMNDPIVSSGEEACNILAGSMRAFDDLCDIYDIKKPVFLVLQEVLDIQKKYEFRCFVKDKKLIGASQYHYTNYFDGLAAELPEIEMLIREMYSKITDIFPENNYVFDVFIDSGKAHLIEVNPYGLSDPCLYSTYANLEHCTDFKIKIVEKEHMIMSKDKERMAR